MKRIYTIAGFPGHWPVGTAAVIVAKDRGHARRLLIDEAKEHGLRLRARDLTLDMFLELPLENHCLILNNGDY